MKAIIKKDLGEVEYVLDRPLPQLPEGYILVKTKAVALNPIDWMKIDTFPAPDTLLGHDYAGVVEAIGEGVTRSFNKGDRVFGYAIGGDHRQPENGTFAEYIVAKADLQHHIPEGMSFANASTLGAAMFSANMALYMKLGLVEERERVPLNSKGQYVLVYGGSTSSGAMAIQMSVRSGYTVISTCSPHNSEDVKALGAAHVFDYRQTDSAAAIRKLTGDRLELVVDTIAVPQSASFCAEAISFHGGRYVEFLPVPFPRTDVEVMFMDATTSLGEYYEYGPERMPIPIDSDAFIFGKSHVDTNERLLKEGEILPHNIEIGFGGLERIPEGLQRLRSGKVSGRKLVYVLEEST